MANTAPATAEPATTASPPNKTVRTLIVSAAIIVAAAIIGVTITTSGTPADSTSSASAEARQDAQSAAERAATKREAAVKATQDLVKLNADHVAAILTRNAAEAGAVTIGSYVEQLGVTDAAIDRALAVQFAGADVVVDYVMSDPAPVIRVWHDEDYKVSINISNSIAEVFAPIV